MTNIVDELTRILLTWTYYIYHGLILFSNLLAFLYYLLWLTTSLGVSIVSRFVSLSIGLSLGLIFFSYYSLYHQFLLLKLQYKGDLFHILNDSHLFQREVCRVTKRGFVFFQYFISLALERLRLPIIISDWHRTALSL